MRDLAEQGFFPTNPTDKQVKAYEAAEYSLINEHDWKFRDFVLPRGIRPHNKSKFIEYHELKPYCGWFRITNDHIVIVSRECAAIKNPVFVKHFIRASEITSEI